MGVWRKRIGLTALLLAGVSLASPVLHLAVDHLRYGPLKLENASANLTPTEGYRLAFDRLSLAAPPWQIDRLTLACPNGRLTTRALECRQGNLALHLPRLGQPLKANFSARMGSDVGGMTLAPIRFAGGRWRLTGDYRGNDWQAEFQIDRQPLATDWIKPLFSGALAWLSRLEGHLAGHLNAAGSPAIDQVNLNLKGTGLTFNDPDYTRVAEGLAVTLQFQGDKPLRHPPSGNRWLGDLNLEIPAGEGLYLPVYVPFKQHPVRLRTRYAWNDRTTELELKDFGLVQQDVLTVTAEQARIEHGNLSTLSASFRGKLPALFRLYAQPFLAGGNWEGLEITEGTAQGVVIRRRQDPDQAHLYLEDVILTDRDRRLGVNRLNMNLAWQGHPKNADSPSPISRLNWHAAHLYALPIGETEVFFQFTDDDFRLLLPAEVPVLDGHFFIDLLEVFDLSATPRVRFRGHLDQISLEVLTRVLGWPPLTGTLSGTIPNVTYDHRSRTLQLDGRLTVKVFDGTIVIEHLVITDLFGVLPRLRADIRFHNLDLEQVTGHFAFGRITGRLEGHIRQLYLENWRPISFDAWFGTPPDDPSRHRISQKAVKNLTDLGGGGATGALSRTFFRFFEEFGYDRMGLGCRLKNQVCELSGAAPAPDGYYIVKGGGLPRIDVIGYNRRIDWPTLITRLARITQIKQLESPVIEP
ncbi:hypothetical protein [Methylohalobius crimeensis]|uniref:hypothetical protein n=1 Tax=Methylohalobius crimeensis TaxID=244365 RepID=UPI0003B5B532|nr:hypothetical protein [Methylohalobius crimeensis]